MVLVTVLSDIQKMSDNSEWDAHDERDKTNKRTLNSVRNKKIIEDSVT